MASALDRVFLRPMNSVSIKIDRLQTTDTSPPLTGRWQKCKSETPSSISIVVDGNTYAATINVNKTWNIAQGVITPALTLGQIYDVTATATYPSGKTVVDRTTDELSLTSGVSAYEAGPNTNVAYGSSISGVAYGFN